MHKITVLGRKLFATFFVLSEFKVCEFKRQLKVNQLYEDHGEAKTEDGSQHLDREILAYSGIALLKKVFLTAMVKPGGITVGLI